jgi:2-C-methyl-D-erythritol 4-phosphate cytidylyltransferase
MRDRPFTVVFLAGGVGTRMGSPIPKQYLAVHNKPLALYSFEVLTSMPEVEEIIVVSEPQYHEIFLNNVESKGIHLKFASPGMRRQDSVFNAIQLLQGNPLVCVHDSARPMIDPHIVRKVVEAAANYDAAVVAVKARSTIKICDTAQFAVHTPDRATLWEIQTPQVIRLDLLKEGFINAHEKQLSVTDDASLVEALGKSVKIVEGSYKNIKVTTPEDLIFIEQYAMLQAHNCL